MSASVDLFKVLVADRASLDLSNAHLGFITDFTPTASQVRLLREKFQPVPIVTMFSVEERALASPEELVSKQLLHYLEVYGLNALGLFQLECSKGQLATIAFIKAVTLEELTALVHGLIYANRPIGDTASVVDLMREYRIPYDINLVRNNELRVMLFDPRTDRFTSGDDAARYICYYATKSPMLIKSRKVIEEIKKNPVGERFLSEHLLPLANVFNRHERLVMACKQGASKAVVNRISKLSKRHHVPIAEPITKRFISTALAGVTPSLRNIPLRDMFKYLNLIEYRMLGLAHDTFVIRNGKIWAEINRPIADPRRLMEIRKDIISAVSQSLEGLRSRTILLDEHVDYGLPISRKQALGNLPFGTRVIASGEERLSAGIYWHDKKTGQRTDLDLSAIDDKGARTGWGGWAGYDRKNPITFSGDVTAAPNGASEFMVVDPSRSNKYGLLVNIYVGPDECPAEIVVGYPSSPKDNLRESVWQDRTLIRESIMLKGNQSIIGFLKDDAFVVYSGQLSKSRVSGGRPAVISKALGKLWTLRDILDESQIKYHVTPQSGVTYDHDLRYASFSLDKLEQLLGI